MRPVRGLSVELAQSRGSVASFAGSRAHDVSPNPSTRAALPSHRFPGEQGWYFNQGEKAGISDDWFTVAALVSSGH